jgi:hypothetical protein
MPTAVFRITAAKETKARRVSLMAGLVLVPFHALLTRTCSCASMKTKDMLSLTL